MISLGYVVRLEYEQDKMNRTMNRSRYPMDRVVKFLQMIAICKKN